MKILAENREHWPQCRGEALSREKKTLLVYVRIRDRQEKSQQSRMHDDLHSTPPS